MSSRLLLAVDGMSSSCCEQGYGMTETSCVISMTSHGDFVAGHVGGPVVCCEVKLVDIPDMNYTNADKPRPRGEVQGASSSRFFLIFGTQTAVQEMPHK